MVYNPSGRTALLLDSVRIKGRMKLFQAARPAKMLTTPRTGRAIGHRAAPTRYARWRRTPISRSRPVLV